MTRIFALKAKLEQVMNAQVCEANSTMICTMAIKNIEFHVKKKKHKDTQGLGGASGNCA